MLGIGLFILKIAILNLKLLTWKKITDVLKLKSVDISL